MVLQQLVSSSCAFSPFHTYPRGLVKWTCLWRCGLSAPGQKDSMKLYWSLGLASNLSWNLTLCQDLRAKGQSFLNYSEYLKVCFLVLSQVHFGDLVQILKEWWVRTGQFIFSEIHMLHVTKLPNIKRNRSWLTSSPSSIKFTKWDSPAGMVPKDWFPPARSRMSWVERIYESQVSVAVSA